MSTVGCAPAPAATLLEAGRVGGVARRIGLKAHGQRLRGRRRGQGEGKSKEKVHRATPDRRVPR
jgi:hypothetical protein